MKKIVAIVCVTVLMLCFGSAYASGENYVDAVEDFKMYADVYFGMTVSEIREKVEKEYIYKYYGEEALKEGSSTNGDPCYYVYNTNVAGVSGVNVHFFFSPQSRKLYQVTYQFPYSVYEEVRAAYIQKYGAVNSLNQKYVFKNPKTSGTDFTIGITLDRVDYSSTTKPSTYKVVYSLWGDYRNELDRVTINFNGI